MHGSHGAHRVPLDLLFFRPPPCVVPFPFFSSPAVAPYRHTSPTRRIHHSLLSRVTLYLFKAPSDRPSAVCTESTWRFRWDLTARGRENLADAHIRVLGEGEGERPLRSISTGRFSISARITIARRRDFHASSDSQQADYTHR